MKLSFLQQLYEYPGPFATVYLDTSGDAEDAAKAIELRWRSAREQLERQGADGGTVDALDRTLGEHEWRTGQRGQVLVATGGEVVFTDELPEPPTQFADDERVRYSRLPHLLPYLRMRGARIPHVVAVVDHEGADIRVVHATRRAVDTTLEVPGSPVRKSTSTGRGNEQRHENAVEEQWKATADEIADEITRHAREIAAEVVLLAGDVQQRKLVVDRLRKGIEELVVSTDASHRDRKASGDTLDAAVSEVITERVEAHITETITEFEAEKGRQERATEGWEPVVHALRQGQVDTVLLHPDDDVPDALYVGPEPTRIATRPEELTEGGTNSAEQVPAADAVIRALAATDAGLVFAGPDRVRMAGGIGAVLRFTVSP